MSVNQKRVRKLNKIDASASHGPVVYWMQRDQRAADNWALLYAQELALNNKQPLAVVFNLVPKFLDASLRQYDFMIRGLQELEQTLGDKNIPFFLLLGDPTENLPKFISNYKAATLVTDFSPLRVVLTWKHQVSKQIEIPFYEVDAHNVVPVWEASPKQEFGAYTIRPKIHKLLPEFLTDFPRLKKHSVDWQGKLQKTDWKKAVKTLEINEDIKPVDWIKPGEKAAQKAFEHFVAGSRFKKYSIERNDPNADAQSELSPYLHFGQIAPQRVAYEVSHMRASESRESFIEELVVRRELADNFCFYNPHYDSYEGFPEWGKKTLQEHKHDHREYLYSYKELEQGKTHDELWNAAQLEMVHKGKMHNYMRMYWAKKILEWTPDAETAMKYAVKLNDAYELDGRDPNGYVGCAWSIGGLHDRAWGEREIFGKIRFMSYNGAKGKFKIKDYVDYVNSLASKTLF